jgi:hypothetical protein
MTAVKPLTTLASFLLLATPAAVATAGSLQIIPRGIDCVIADRFPRIDALLTPPDQVSLARVLFRTKDSEGWYWVRMDHEGDRFVAVLPKPGKGLKDFRYYIEASDTEFETSQTPEYEPQVVVDPEACRAKMIASTVASAKVIMHVPTGYKVPPVPGGFSVRGTLRTGEERLGIFPHMSLTTALLAAGAVGAGAVAVGLSVAKPTNMNQGTVTLLDSTPPPGSTISLSSGSLVVNLRVVTTQDVLPGPVLLSLLRANQTPGSLSPPQSCVSLTSALRPGFAAGTPQNVSFSGLGGSSCSAPFTVSEARLILQGRQGTFVMGVTANYNFVP